MMADGLDMDRLHRDGFAVVDLLGAGALGRLRKAAAGLAPRLRAGFDSTVLSGDLELRAAADRAVRQELAVLMRALAAGYRIAFCSMVVKSARSERSEVPLHQDWSFVDEDRHASFGLWCPLIDVDPGNGCLMVVRGSHAAAHPPRAAFAPFHYPELLGRLRDSLTALPMRAGQAVLFDNRLVHGSPPNRGDSPRVAATAVLIPEAAGLRYHHLVNRRDYDRIEIFEVADNFYLTHEVPSRPDGAASLGLVDIAAARTAAVPFVLPA
jgi:hypothetical protein